MGVEDGTAANGAVPPPPAAQPPQGPPPPAQGHYGYPQQPVVAAPMVAVPVGTRDDYNLACVGTVCCGGFGCLGTMCCCNTPTGRYGSATGCIVHSIVQVVVTVILLILVAAKAVECNSNISPPLTQSACLVSKTYQWLPNGDCVLVRCPSGYKQVGATGTKDAYCKNDDWESCLGVRSIPWQIVEAALFLCAAVASVYYRKIYKRQLEEFNNNPQAYAPMVGAAYVQPAYAQPYPAQPAYPPQGGYPPAPQPAAPPQQPSQV